MILLEYGHIDMKVLSILMMTMTLQCTVGNDDDDEDLNIVNPLDPLFFPTVNKFLA